MYYYIRFGNIIIFIVLGFLLLKKKTKKTPLKITVKVRDHFHRFHYYNILIFTKRVQIQIQQYRQIMLCRVVCMIDKKVQRISMWCNFKHYVKNILSNEI